MPEIMQHESRQNYMFHDQHGRQWLAIVDTRTKPYLAPCVEPWAQFAAPIMPYGTLLVPDPTQLGRLNINYARWEEEAVAAERAYLAQLEQTANVMYGEKATDAITKKDPRLMAAMGPAPVSPVFIRAAASGQSKWVLGLTKDDGSAYPTPPWADPLLETLPQFRKQVTQQELAAMEFGDVEDEAAAEDEEAESPAPRRRGRPPRVAVEG
jgi:hypothetical protein